MSLATRLKRLETTLAPKQSRTVVTVYGDDVESELQRRYGDGPRPDDLFVINITGPSPEDTERWRARLRKAGCSEEEIGCVTGGERGGEDRWRTLNRLRHPGTG